ncbi:MAG: PTS sugar transporter subunit IIC, partial [Sarcina sp.]
MDKFMGLMDKYVVPVAAKIGAQRHLVAIRDAFVSMIALAMVGSLATLVNNLPWPAYQDFMASIFGEGWKTLGGDIWWGTLALMSLFVVFGVAYNLAVSYKEDGLQAGLIATSIFFILAPQVASFTTEAGEAVSGWGFVPSAYVGTSALFTAIIVGLLATECFVKLSKIKQLTIKLPAGVPPAVSRSFAKLIPGMITIILFATVGMLLRFGTGQFLTDLINKYVGTPLRNVADSLPSAMFIALIVHLLWFVGLHGTNIVLPFTQTLLMDLGAQNAELVQAGAKVSELNILAGPFFDAFVYLGGAGTCLGLIVAIIIAGKRRRDMVALGGAPACFNINEPV